MLIYLILLTCPYDTAQIKAVLPWLSNWLMLAPKTSDIMHFLKTNLYKPFFVSYLKALRPTSYQVQSIKLLVTKFPFKTDSAKLQCKYS